MPSKSPKLAKLIIKNFEDWIRMGAPDPRANKPTKEEHLEEIVFDCTLKNKHLKYTYREFLGQMLKKESFHQWIVQAQADC